MFLCERCLVSPLGEELGTTESISLPAVYGKSEAAESDVMPGLLNRRVEKDSATEVELRAPEGGLATLADWETKVVRLEDLCRDGSILEAIALLEELERQGNDPQHRGIQQRLQEFPVLVHLRKAMGRRQAAFRLVAGPAFNEGEIWTTTTIKDPTLGDDYYVELQIRAVKNNERDPNGARAQFVVRSSLHNYPVSMTDVVTMSMELDLFKKEWLNCQQFCGSAGGPDSIYTAVSSSIFSIKMLPFALEDAFHRDVFICEERPDIPGSRPGVTTVECPIADSAMEFSKLHRTSLSSASASDGPASRKWTVPLSGTFKVNHFMPGLKGPGFTDSITAMRIGLPFFQWMVPLESFKAATAEICNTAMRDLKVNLFDKWSELQYSSRQAKHSAFYGRMQRMIDDSAATKLACSDSMS